MPRLIALAGLTPEQAAAVTHPPDGQALLIIAGAGSGKTLTLAARVAALVQQGVDPQRLLLITFSRRAAAEMATRAARLLHQLAGLSAGVPPPRLPWCGTFHSVAARLLREHAAVLGLDAGFSVLDRGDAQELMTIARQRLGLARGSGRLRFPLADTCGAILSRVLNTGQPLAAVLEAHFPWCRMHEQDLGRLFDAYGAEKQAQRALDFDDLLLGWHTLLIAPELSASAAALQARFTHVLVDEVQDINTLQAGIVHALRHGGRGLTAVGDDAQAIYGFRGADQRHVLDLPAHCSPPAQVLPLTQNHRSTPAILAAANATIAAASDGFRKTLWSARADGPRPQLVTVADESAQARGVADAVLLAREQGITLRRQAVLFRSAPHSAALELELLRRQIPFVKYGGLRFLEAAHVKDVLAVLRWAANPAARMAALRVARLVPGLGPAALTRLATTLEAGNTEGGACFCPPPAARAAWATLKELLAALRGSRWPWPAELPAVLDWYQPHLERLHADARVRRTDLDSLARIAATHASRERFLTELALDPPSASSDEAGPPGLDEDWLVLSTIHSAKGQEWSAVQVLSVVDGCLPADLSTGRAAEIEEERRLLYVAMTRARDALTLWLPQRFHVTRQQALGGRHVYALPSRFLTPAVMGCCEAVTLGADAVAEEELPSGAGPAPALASAGTAFAGPADLARATGAAGAAGAADGPGMGRQPPALDLAARLRGAWRQGN